MSFRKSRAATGIGFVVVGVLIASSWAVYASWPRPGETALEIKDGAAFSVIPISLSLIALIWGLVLIGQARRRQR